jgi:hypothetical protein
VPVVERAIEDRLPESGIADEFVPVGRVGDGLLEAGESLAWEYAGHPQNDRQPRNRVIDRAVARLYAARARREALELNRMGRYDEATSLLERVRRRIESYAGNDPELRQIAEDLRVDFGEYAMPMTPMVRKGRYYEASNLLRNRDALGMARREKAPR